MIVQFTVDDLEAIRFVVKEELEKIHQIKQEWLTRTEVCQKLGIDKSTYHRHIREGRLKVKTLGNKVSIVD